MWQEEQIIYKTDLIEPIVSEELWDKANDSYRKKCEGFANIGAYVVYKQIYKETRSEIAKRYIEQSKNTFLTFLKIKI